MSDRSDAVRSGTSLVPIDIHDDDRAVRFRVHVQPRASRTEVSGIHGRALKVRLQAPPVEGAANDALVELLAEILGVPRRDVRIVGGHSSREKIVEVTGVTRAAVERIVPS